MVGDSRADTSLPVACVETRRTSRCAGPKSRKEADGKPATDILSKVHQQHTLPNEQEVPPGKITHHVCAHTVLRCVCAAGRRSLIAPEASACILAGFV